MYFRMASRLAFEMSELVYTTRTSSGTNCSRPSIELAICFTPGIFCLIALYRRSRILAMSTPLSKLS